MGHFEYDLMKKVLPAMASSYRNLLKNIGEDPTREGLLDTPMRSLNNENFIKMLYYDDHREMSTGQQRH